MRTEVYWVVDCPIGRVALLAGPRGNDWLDGEIEEWKKAGINRVVSLLEVAEAIELGLDREAEDCRKFGLKFDQFAVPDRGTPISEAGFSDLIASVVGSMQSG